MSIKAAFFWSGGKDSALALNRIQQDKDIEIISLVSTINTALQRVTMHGVRLDLIEAQAGSIGIPLKKMFIGEGTNAEYEVRFLETCQELKSEGVTHLIYGDIFLRDLRAYRDTLHDRAGLKAIYPIWENNETELISEYELGGFKAITCCLNGLYFSEKDLGCELNKEFFSTLPMEVNKMGENGEYHSFCYDGPSFKEPLKFFKGEKIFRPLEVKRTDCTLDADPASGFWFQDLLLEQGL